MGSTSALIGGLIMIFAHTITVLDSSGGTSLFVLGFFLVYSQFSGSGQSDSDTYSFDTNWLKDDEPFTQNSVGSYEFIFGQALFGIIILILIIVAIIFSIAKDDSPLGGLFFIVAAGLLIFFRFQELADSDTFFYENENSITYVEIPLGFIAGLIAGLRNIKSS